MTEGLSDANDMSTNGNQLSDILRRLADASQDEASIPLRQDYFHINAEAYPHMAEAAERVSQELQLCDGQKRMIEATAIAASILWPNAHGDHDVHLLDSRLGPNRSAVDPEIYKKSYQELEDALTQERKRYLHTFWTQTSQGLIVPSLRRDQMEFMVDFIEQSLDDPKSFHTSMLQFVLPHFAARAKIQTQHAAETYLALREAVEASAVGWIIDPFSAKGRTPTEIKQIIGWNNDQLDILSEVDPFDGYEDEPLHSYPYVSFMPRIVGGRKGGRAITELGSRNPIPKV